MGWAGDWVNMNVDVDYDDDGVGCKVDSVG